MKAPGRGVALAGCGYIKHGHGSQSTPTMHGVAGCEVVEVQIGCGEELGQHDDLTGVHRNGKRNPNRFPIFYLQTR